MSAMATANPTAADMKFCQVSPTICVKYDAPVSPGVSLPVRVGDKAHSGVEGEIGTHAGGMCYIPRQESLQPQERIQQQRADRTERQQRIGIGGPAHFACGIDPANAVDDPLKWTENRIDKRALAGKDVSHVGTERFGERQ